jgi:hypothetical protein
MLTRRDFLRGAMGNQVAFIEDCDPISHAPRAMHVMGYDDQGRPLLGLLF